MRRGRLLLPWGLLAGLLLWTAAIEGLNIKAPSLLKKPRNLTTNSSATTSTTTTIEPTELEEELAEEEDPSAAAEETSEASNTTTSHLTGDPQKDYRFDPNLPRELPIGYNLSAYPFFSRVPNDVEFVCTDDLLDGYYANVHYKCQVYHHCLSGIRYDFLCANYTAFDQKTFICHFVSEVDCANSAKFWNRNKGLYETPTTTTIKPLTTAPPPTAAPAHGHARRPASGRRRRPYRRRRPQYDYYEDEDEYYDEYEDDLTGPAQSVGRGAGGTSRNRPSSSEAPTDDKPFKADKSIYDRPRQAPQIRRPVPLNERDKYEYATKDGDKRPRDEGDRPAQDRDPDRKRTHESSDYDKPSRPRQKARPASDDDEYYDEEDYDQPRTPSRKQHAHSQDYYGATGADRDFVRRPAMSGQGKPLRRNRPGARRKPVDDDDYYDDDRRSRPTAPESDSRRRPQNDEPTRRRPDADRRRPAGDDAPRRRPMDDDEPRRRRPVDAEDEAPRKREEGRRRPAIVEEEVVARKRPVDEEAPSRRRPISDDVPSRKRPLDDEVPSRKRPYDDEVPSRKRPIDDEVPSRKRPIDDEAPSRKRPIEDDVPSRKRPLDDEVPSRKRPVDDEARRPAGSSRKRGPQRDEFERETNYERSASRESFAHREADKERPLAVPARERPISGRDAGKDKVRATPLPASEIPLSTYTRETTPRSRGPTSLEQTSARSRDFGDDRRPATAPSGGGATRTRTRTEDADYGPIPAPKPAYISTTGRGSTTHRKAMEDEARIPPTASAARPSLRNAARMTTTTTTTTTTEAPLLDDEEYYDDDEEVDELPSRPTGPGNVYQEATSVPKQEAVTPLRSRPTGREDSFAEDKTRVPSSGRESGRRPEKESIDVRQGSRVEVSTEGIADRPLTHARPLDQGPSKHSSSSSYRFNEDGVLLETLPSRPGFRPKSTTTAAPYQQPSTEAPIEEVHQRPAYQSNYRRKTNQASNIESTKVLAPNDEVSGVSEDVHISPSGPEAYAPTESTVQTTEAPIRLETEAFEVAKPTYGSLPPTGPSGRGNLNFRKNTPRPLEEYPRRPVLPDITDPEYDVTLNEAIHPTPLPFSSEGIPRIKVKVPLYNYRDGDYPGTKKGSTLQSSASQNHEAKAPFPLHDKATDDEEYENATEEDDYEDLPIPTGKGAEPPRAEDEAIPTGRGSTVRYEWTTSNPNEYRGSEASLPPNQATTSQQYYVNNQQTQQPPLQQQQHHQQHQHQQQQQQQQKVPVAARGSLREYEQQIYVPTRNANQQYYKSTAADLYRGPLNPLLFSQSYDYDLAPKYRPRRKYYARDVQDYFGKLY